MKITSEIPPFIVYYVIDGMVLLEEDYLCNLVILARQLLMKLCRLSAYRIDFVFDRYTSPSIKNSDMFASLPIMTDILLILDLVKTDAEKYYLQRPLIYFLVTAWQENMFCEMLREKVLLCKFPRNEIHFV